MQVDSGVAELVSGGAMTFGFGAFLLAYVHFVLPRFNRLLGFSPWHEGRWARRWNYGVPLPFILIGGGMMIVGMVRLVADAVSG